MARYDDAGQLNRKITFQRFIGEGDLVGDYQYLDDSNWEGVLTVWASVRTIGSRQFMAAGQEQDEVTHDIKVRRRDWDEDVTCMRVVYLGKRYRLLSPPLDLPDNRSYQLIKAAEVWQ